MAHPGGVCVLEFKRRNLESEAPGRRGGWTSASGVVSLSCSPSFFFFYTTIPVLTLVWFDLRFTP